jgi:hypothetical protein
MVREKCRGEQHMAWRLYDVIEGQWYNDELYETHEACLTAGAHHMQAAHIVGEELELIAEPLDATEALESLLEEEEQS